MQEKSTRRSNAARTEAMRTALLAAARTCFVDNGYADTSTPQVVSAAGVTRGALYHHFKDKTDLFRHVVISEAEAVSDTIAGVPDGAEPLDALIAGTDAYFAAMAVPGRVRLLLRDGPAVLGMSAMQEILDAAGGAELRAGLAAMLEDTDVSVAALADMISAGFDRAALAIADGRSGEAYRRGIVHLLTSLRASAGRGA